MADHIPFLVDTVTRIASVENIKNCCNGFSVITLKKKDRGVLAIELVK